MLKLLLNLPWGINLPVARVLIVTDSINVFGDFLAKTKCAQQLMKYNVIFFKWMLL
jgi:hypothetical protein